MLWKSKLEKLLKSPMKYPKSIKYNFLWKTSCVNSLETKFEEEFIREDMLDVPQDFSPFEEYINSSNDKNVISFPNISGDTFLIVPMPRKGKNFASLKDFIDNASETQQLKFWQEVVKVAKIKLQDWKRVWISTHGLGVSYLHVRISKNPKYYGNSKFLF